MLTKAPGYGAQGYIPDLEDSVPNREKQGARDIVASALPDLASGGVPIVPRVNSLGTGFSEGDIAAVVGPHIAAISIGKVRDQSDIEQLSELLSTAERAAGVTVGSIGILPWIETAAAVHNALAICSASPRIRWIAFGAEDFSADMGISRAADTGSTGDLHPDYGEPSLLYARSAVVVAARAAGVDALDTPYVKFTDPEGLEREARLARSLGYRGKLAIHPSQIEPIHRVFSPSPEDVQHATRVVEAADAAAAEGRGAIAMEGQMIDAPVVERARYVLREAGVE